MLGLAHNERNWLEDSERVVEKLKRNGTVDNLHSQAIKALFESESFKADARQWLQQLDKGPKTDKRREEEREALLDMALAALSGLLAGTADTQPQQQQQQPTSAAAAPAGPSSSSQPTPAQQPQQQQLQRPGLGQQQQQQQPQHAPMQRQQLPAAAGSSRRHQQQQRPQLSVSEDAALKLQVALIQMLETEERYLQATFRAYYRQHMQALQHYRPFEPLDYIAAKAAVAAAPKKDGEVDSPLSPKAKYSAEEFLEPEQQPKQEQQQQQQQQQYVQGLHQHVQAGPAGFQVQQHVQVGAGGFQLTQTMQWH